MDASDATVPTTPRLPSKRLAVAAGVAGAMLFGMVLMSLLQRQQAVSQVPPPPLPPIYEVQGEANGLQQLNLQTSWAGVDRTPPSPPEPPAQPLLTPPAPQMASVAPVSTPVASLPPIPAMPVAHTPPSARTPATTAHAAAPPAQQPTSTPKPPRKSWDFLAQRTDEKRGKTPAPEGQASPRTEGSQLVKPATWAIPANPLRTLYRSQRLAGQTLDVVNSDIPGQVRVLLTVPILDKFGYDQTILPKGSIVIAKQAGGAQYGQSRLPIQVEQVEFPSGAILSLKSTVGDSEGASGITGKVNRHTGKLLAGAALNAILNIGARSLAGTPGRGQYYQNPAQEAVQDMGQSIQRDAQSMIDRELRVPPTITVPAGTFVTIALEENIQFSPTAPIVK